MSNLVYEVNLSDDEFLISGLSWHTGGEISLAGGEGLGFLLSGGWSGRERSVGRSVEIYRPGGDTACNVTDLPDLRSGHSQDSAGLICGGKDSSTSCLEWRGQKWVRTKQDLPQAGYTVTCLV